ncbi:MAG: sigma-54 dependent transcriptional regulator [Deltaproteobacteria bacterium]|nr:sigma-54 dependent transcriptional regulator [Deltaproteobacteria bacterium]
MSRPRILLCDDEVNIRKVLGALLKQAGYEVHAEPDGEAALGRIRTSPSGTFDAVLSDIRMPRMDGMALLRALSQEDPQLPVILLTAHGSVDSAVEAVKAGAFDYLEKPFEIEQVKTVLAKAVATRERSGASVGKTPPPAMPADPSDEVGMIGNSPQMERVREIVRTAAASPTTVLIAGESGTGKELVARALHLGSPRREAPFIRVNSAAIPAGLTESELFGHERGAFTGAVSTRQGRFELADGGTLFLDEVSEIPLEIQVKLLRAIQESEFERVGGTKTNRVDVRLIAASNRNLEDDIKSGRFREDLYYRLAVVPIELPALRDRIQDLRPLIEHFVSRCNQRLDKQVVGFSEDALLALGQYTWPGNIRELENLVERMVLFASEPTIGRDALPETFLEPQARGDASADPPIAMPSHVDSEEDDGDGQERLLRLPLSSLGLDLKEAVRQGSRLVETELITEALAQTHGNVTRSARLLGISRRSLQSKMKELGLRTPTDEGSPKGAGPG